MGDLSLPERIDLNVRDAMELAGELFRAAHYSDAEHLFRAVVEAEPQNFDAVNGVALSLAQDGGDYQQALTWFDRAFVIARDEMLALSCNRGRALGELGRSDEALAMFENVLRSAPQFSLARYNRGLIQLQLGRYLPAIHDFNAVLERDPENALAHFGRGFAYLVLGNYGQGFKDYEYRLKDDLQEPEQDGQKVPLWTGAEELAGKTILVMGEMGHGDNIMFARYLPLMVARGARVVVAVSPESRSLIAGIPGVDVVDEDRARWPKLHYWVRFMSLALCFGTTAQTVPAPMPIAFDPHELKVWVESIGRRDGRLKVGLVWSGSRKSRYDSHRSVPLAALAPLFDVRDVEFFSLQFDVRESDQAAYHRLVATDLTQGIRTFRDTAHAMKCLDLVITCDTSVAHLAGSVDIPTWIMLTSYRTYWLWIEKRETSPWYPSARLFRQERDGDWAGVVSRIRDVLAQMARARAA